MKITNLLRDYPALLNEWENFEVGRAYSRKPTKEKYNLFINFLKIKRQNNKEEETAFKKGINYIENEETFYILKFILTGKIEKKYKETIKELRLELSINKRNVSIYIRLHPTYGEITDEANNETIRTKNLKELKSSFNNFFQYKLIFPYLINNITDNKLSKYPITFASYFNCFFIDLKNPYKLFLSQSSIFWRKRVLQIIVGFRGISLISFFNSLLNENAFHKKMLVNRILSIEKDILAAKERRPWQKTFLELLEKERKLIKELEEIDKINLKEYYSDAGKEIEIEINKCSKSLQSYKTKELLVLKEIKYLGGDFQKRKSKIETIKEQYAFYIPNKENKNKEKIDILIGDYYINTSKIEILTEELKDLSGKEKEEIENVQRNINRRKEELRLEIQNTVGNYSKLLYKHSISVDKTIKELLKRKLDEEALIIERIISSLKTKYREEHNKILNKFLSLLKDRLINHFESLELLRINKDYIPILKHKNGSKTDFRSLNDEDKQYFTICFYISLAEFSIKGYGHHPRTLFLMGNFSHIGLIENLNNKAQVFLTH